MIIYKVTNKINNKVYIGQSVNSLEIRKSQHFRETKFHSKDHTYFHNALRKYTESDWIWEVIEEVTTTEELNEREIYWISFYDSSNMDKGYNLKSGGNNGGLNSESTKLLIGQSTKERWNNPEIAEKMLNGLRKGAETIKLKAEQNRKYDICQICGKQIPVINSLHHKTCSKECLSKYKSLYNPGLDKINYQKCTPNLQETVRTEG